VGAVVVSGERVPIQAGRAAHDPLPVVAGIHGVILSRPVVGYQAFDEKNP
jgi:hypothetical protein